MLQGHNSPVMRARNRSAVLQLLLARGPMARRDMAAVLALTPATMTNVVRELIDLGLVEERPDVDAALAAVTRRPIPIDLRAEGAYAVGVNIGRTGTGVGLVDLKGELRATAGFNHDEHAPDALVRRLAAAIAGIVAEVPGAERAVIGVGVGVAGVVEPRAGVVRSQLGLGWRDVPLGDLLGAALGRRVFVENNVHGMAVSERLYGVAVGASNFVLFFASTVVGAGIVVDGSLLHGHEFAGLIGHIVVDPDGPPCACGSRGCLEAVAGNGALVDAARAAIAAGRPTLLRGRLSEGDAVPAAIQLVSDAARAGDELAIELYRRQARAVGWGIATVFNLLDPELVVLAAPVVRQELDLSGQDFLSLVRQTVRERACLLADPDRRIVASRFGTDATVRGGAAVALARFVEEASFGELAGAAPARAGIDGARA